MKSILKHKADLTKMALTLTPTRNSFAPSPRTEEAGPLDQSGGFTFSAFMQNSLSSDEETDGYIAAVQLSEDASDRLYQILKHLQKYEKLIQNAANELRRAGELLVSHGLVVKETETLEEAGECYKSAGQFSQIYANQLATSQERLSKSFTAPLSECVQQDLLETKSLRKMIEKAKIDRESRLNEKKPPDGEEGRSLISDRIDAMLLRQKRQPIQVHCFLRTFEFFLSNCAENLAHHLESVKNRLTEEDLKTGAQMEQAVLMRLTAKGPDDKKIIEESRQMRQKVSEFDEIDKYEIPDDPISHLVCTIAREEKRYLAELALVQSHFKRAWETDEKLKLRLLETDHDAIFGNITEVYTNTALMMKSIFVCVRTNPSCFPSLLPDNEEWIIPTYSRYFQLYPRAINVLETAKKQSRYFSAFLTYGTADLLNILSLPLKRTRQYMHTLEALVAILPMENPSLPRVTACLMNMSALVQESFDAINQLQSLNQVTATLDKLVGIDTTSFPSSRAFLFEGQLLHTTSVPEFPGEKEPLPKANLFVREKFQINHFFLFSDCLLETVVNKGHKKTYRVQRTISLGRAKLKILQFDPLEVQNLFQIIVPGKVYDEAVTFSAGTKEAMNEWIEGINTAFSSLRKTKVFCIPIKELMKRRHNRERVIPNVVQRCIDYLILKGLETEGIFRLSGRRDDIDRMRSQFDSGEDVDFTNADVNDVAGLLKLWMREHPEPLLPEPLVTEFNSTFQKEESEGDEQDRSAKKTKKRVKVLRKNITKLPTHQLNLVQLLMKFFHLVTTYSEKNKMNSRNMAIVVAPNMFGTSDNLQQNTDSSKFVAFMIEYYSEIFGTIEKERLEMIEKKNKIRLERLKEFESDPDLMRWKDQTEESFKVGAHLFTEKARTGQDGSGQGGQSHSGNQRDSLRFGKGNRPIPQKELPSVPPRLRPPPSPSPSPPPASSPSPSPSPPTRSHSPASVSLSSTPTSSASVSAPSLASYLIEEGPPPLPRTESPALPSVTPFNSDSLPLTEPSPLALTQTEEEEEGSPNPPNQPEPAF